MIFIDKMKNLKIYKTKTFLPTIEGDKKRKSAILLMTPNYDSSKRLMNSDLFINNRRYASYYIERDVSFYINSKEVEELEESTIINEQNELKLCLETNRSDLDDSDFGIPDKRKFPLDTESHVKSAIKFFNYVDSENEEELAKKIISKMKKFNIYGKVNVGEKNRFSKYYNQRVAIKETPDIRKYHLITSQLDLLYNQWKNGTVSEQVSREKIYRCMCNNMVTDEYITSPETVPSIEEYYSSKGELIPERESSMNTDEFLKYIPENGTINTGDKIIFFNESTANDNRLKKLLYQSRIRYRKDLLNLLDNAKKDNPWITWAYPELKKYMTRNVFVDLYFYNAVFFENNTWILKKGMGLYLDFMNRLLNHPNLVKNGYKKKTIFIPVKDWDLNRDSSICNFRQSLNPISCIYQMMFENMSSQLKNTFGDTDIIFVGNDKYFKMNFSQIDPKELKKLSMKFKMFCIKICKDEEFDDSDIDTSADHKEDSKVIATKIADKIELAKGVDITPNLAKAEKKNTTEKDLNDKIKMNKNKMISKLNYDDDNIDNITVQNKATKNAKSDEDYDEDYDQSEENTERDENIDKLAQAVAKASQNSDSEEDAMEDSSLDNDEIKSILANLGSDDEVKISDSRSSRMTKLDQDLMHKQVNGKSVEEILNDNKNKEPEYTEVNVSSPNKEEWSKLAYVNFDKNYNIDKDIIAIFRSFKDCSRPLVVRDLKVTDNSTSEDRLMLYDVDMEDYRGKRFRIKLDIPIMEDNRFLLRGNYNSIQTQFFNMPIIKTDLKACQLISNYNKIFLYRFNDTRGKTLPAVSKLIKAANKYTGRKIKFTTGDNTKVCSKYNLPIDYIDLAGIFNTIETDEFIIYFNQDEIRSKYKIEPGKGFPFAFNKKLNAVEYFPPNIEETFVSVITSNLFAYCPEFEEIFDSVSRATVCAYTRASIMSSKIPVALICAYHIGLRATMDRAKISYKIVDKLTRDIKSNVNLDWVEFNDGYVVYHVNYESSLLMNGLKVCPTDMYSVADIDNKEMYVEFLDNFGGRIKADGLDNFYDLFVDPMIKESLEYYNFPTNYIDILLYGSSLLNDNKFVRHVDASSRKLRRYQLIAVYTYQVLANAYGYFATQLKHSRQSATFSVKQSAVIDLFLQDTISSPDSCINALRDVETNNAITAKGPSGMNADRSYSLDKRGYDESMLNVLGMSTGQAGNAGVTRQTTINANVTPDGYVKTKNKEDEMNDANTLTATEALIPFGSTRDDPARTAMSFIQTSKHMVRTEDSDPLLVTSGADEVMPYLTTDKFAFKAKDDGTILEIDEHHILVEYKNGKKDYINLDETIEHNSDGGYYVPLKIDADPKLKVSMKFKKNQVLAYDKYSFSNSLGESDNIAYNIGKLAKVAVINTDDGFEDSGIISSSMAKKLATRVDVKFSVVIDKDSRVYNIAKVGDHIEASDVLIMWEDSFDDEDSRQVMDALANGNISDLGKRKLKSEVTGTLKAIKMYRTVELSELSPSLKKIVSEYEKPYVERAKKLKDNGLPIYSVPAHYVLPPTGKLKKAQEAVLIEFFVEYLDTIGVGDKVVYNSANKAVEKGIFPEGKEPYTEFRPNEKIDAFVSDVSISKRLVTSTIIYGSLQKLMVELDRSIKDIMGIPYDDTQV